MKILKILICLTLAYFGGAIAQRESLDEVMKRMHTCVKSYHKSEFDEANFCYSRLLPAMGGAMSAMVAKELASYGESLLGAGNYLEGWKYREQRLFLPGYRELKKPWDGSCPTGKTILIRLEGGAGDVFLFLRYALILKLIFNARVIVHLEKMTFLKESIEHCAYYAHNNVLIRYVDKVITADDEEPYFDYDVFIMSLPMYINHDQYAKKFNLATTTLYTIPTLGKYIHGHSAKNAEWKIKLPKDKFKVGICWGSGKFLAGVERFLDRDIPLSLLVPLGANPDVALYSLHTELPIREKNVTPDLGVDQLNNIIPNDAPTVYAFAKFDKQTHDFDKINGSFMDTISVIENLDLVVSVDTACAHLAGAMNGKTWILLPKESDWRWFKGQPQNSLWHPRARLFWQQQQGDWQSVMDNLIKELNKEVAQWKSSRTI